MRHGGAVLGLLAAAWASTAAAQVTPAPGLAIGIGGWDLAAVVEARLRAEYWREAGTKEGGRLVERARLGVDATGDPFEVRVVLQQAVVSGAGSDLTGGTARFALTEPHELWGQWQAATSSSFLRVGRQPVAWGEGRLLGTNDWSATGRALDALRGHVMIGRSSFELLGALLTSPDVPTVAPYGGLLGARAEAALDPLLAFEAYVLARLAEANPVPNLNGTVQGQTYTSAFRAYGRTRRLDWAIEAACQFGHVDELGKDRRAWAAVSHLDYAFDTLPLRPTLRLGGAYASGAGDGATYGAFDPLWPDTHASHGAMGLFAWSNEEEVSAGVAVEPFSHGRLVAEYRYVGLAQATGAWLTEDLMRVGSAAANERRDLAHEWDATVVWSKGALLELSARYSLLALGAGGLAIVRANQLGTGDVSRFASLQATFRIP